MVIIDRVHTNLMEQVLWIFVDNRRRKLMWILSLRNEISRLTFWNLFPSPPFYIYLNSLYLALLIFSAHTYFLYCWSSFSSYTCYLDGEDGEKRKNLNMYFFGLRLLRLSQISILFFFTFSHSSPSLYFLSILQH